jgi:porin
MGFFIYNFSDALQDSVASVVNLDDEQGLEVFYHWAVTPWFRLTADLQVIAPARGDHDTVTYAGLRAHVTF